MRKLLSLIVILFLLFSLASPMAAEGLGENNEIYFYVLRTAINPGYYFSGILIDMGITLDAGDVDKDTFSVKARVTEYNGDVQGSFGNFAWDPEKESYALGDGWAVWNITDAYVSDAEGNRVDRGEYVKLDIEWGTRTEPSGADARRYDVPATRAAWYTGGGGYISYASVEVVLEQKKEIPGVSGAVYVQGETRHDPLFDRFEIKDAPGGGKYALFKPDNASENNKRPLLVWFHGTGERYHGDNPGGNLVGNRVLAFADKEFQETLGGCYVLAPQSTTAGWSAARLNDMETLINNVIAENHIDVTRIYVGGLSMGTAMTIPLITSTGESSIPFAAAILCSGGSINETQAQVIAEKGFPVYLVGSKSDWAASGLPGAYQNLVSAGVDAKLKIYPEGPVFDGEYYYGAHDAWNYIYNNLVEDENGETIFKWLAKQEIPMPLNVTTNAKMVKKGEPFDVAVAFRDRVHTNTVRVTFKFDSSKFEYIRELGGIDGVTLLTRDEKDGEVGMTLMIPDYNARELAKVRFRAKQDSDLKNENNSIVTVVNYVYRDEFTGVKGIKTTSGSTSFITSSGVPGDTDGDGVITLIDLSNIIDMFGLKKGDAGWSVAQFYDFNGNNEIDIQDIVYVARFVVN